MKITIAEYDPTTRTVTATFTSGDVVHERSVNACYDENGDYNLDLTAERVDEVARGVAVKIALGLIATPTDEATDVEG